MSLGAFFYVGLKFDRVTPWGNLNTNVVVITIVPVETLIGVSPVVQPYISVSIQYTSVALRYTPVVHTYTLKPP